MGSAREHGDGEVQHDDAATAPSVVVVPVPAATEVPVRAPDTPSEHVSGRAGIYSTKELLSKHGYSDECPACTQLLIGHHNATVAHDARGHRRILEEVRQEQEGEPGESRGSKRLRARARTMQAEEAQSQAASTGAENYGSRSVGDGDGGAAGSTYIDVGGPGMSSGVGTRGRKRGLPQGDDGDDAPAHVSRRLQDDGPRNVPDADEHMDSDVSRPPNSGGVDSGSRNLDSGSGNTASSGDAAIDIDALLAKLDNVIHITAKDTPELSAK